MFDDEDDDRDAFLISDLRSLFDSIRRSIRVFSPDLDIDGILSPF